MTGMPGSSASGPPSSEVTLARSVGPMRRMPRYPSQLSARISSRWRRVKVSARGAGVSAISGFSNGAEPGNWLRIGLAHRFDEDLLQSRLHQLKAIYPDFSGNFSQQRLRVRPRRQLQLDIASIAAERCHRRIALQQFAVALIFDLHRVAREARFNFAQFSLEHRLAGVDEQNGVAHA